VEFGLLGPLEVVDGGRPVAIQSAKHRILLAGLLLHAGELVTVEDLTEAIWGGALPASPRRVVHTYVARLRKLLGGSALIQSYREGYMIAVAQGDIDVGRFGLLLERAREAADGGDRHAESAILRKALAQWRGEPLADVPSEALHRDVVAWLAEQRLDALYRQIEADLALGRHTELVAELRILADRHPLREQFWTQLMTALYRCGRQADALAAYQCIRHLLADELGVDPGPELRALHQAILAGDPALADPPRPARPGAWIKPGQLPLDVPDFVGRADLVSQTTQLLDDELTVPIVALSGSPGVGKTALAIHAAHQLTERFRDGQLYVDLHGATTGLQPLQPLEVLGRFLRSLGVEAAAIPADLEEASAAFRSRVAGRRVLVVLDNADDAAQTAPLLPASPGCGVLVTSRRVLSALAGARHLLTDVLPAADAVELLGRLAGPTRVTAERKAAQEVARCCGYLPLALRIAGGRLAARPSWPLRALAERLADAPRCLDELQLAEVGVRASFQVSYQQLSGSPDALERATAKTFGLLGVLDGPEVSLPAAARLMDQPEDAAERVLERLVDAQLLETPVPGRYRLHDLLRLYARELASQRYPEPVRAAALTRVLRFYVASAWQTLAVLRPGDYRLTRADRRWRHGGHEFADQQAALGWLEAERASLLAAVRQAVTTPGVPAEIGMQLAQALFGFFWVHSHQGDWLEVNQIALTVARQLGDLAAQAQAHNDLGAGYYRQGRYDQALACLHESLAIRRELNDCLGQALSLGNLGNVYQGRGRLEEALACLNESLAICRELGDRRGQASNLANLGEVHQRQGRYQRALACLRKSLAIRRDMADRHGQAHSLSNLGIVYQRQAQHHQALVCLRESLAISQELGDRRGEAESLRELGMTLRALGRLEEARVHWIEALAIFGQLQDSCVGQVRALLAGLPKPAIPPTQPALGLRVGAVFSADHLLASADASPAWIVPQSRPPPPPRPSASSEARRRPMSADVQREGSARGQRRHIRPHPAGVGQGRQRRTADPQSRPGLRRARRAVPARPRRARRSLV
jgi:DNA-binding SARP family transcriptional activator/Tfp pilus assembly protein PilF